MNYGGGGGSTQRILIRLRHPGDEGRFYDFNHTLGTMLHEMTHNVCGRHDAAFYKLMEELWSVGALSNLTPTLAGPIPGRF